MVFGDTDFIYINQPFYLALLFGVIASATAPAATIMVIREYKARGTLTDMLLAVVAIDDSWCLLIFSFSLAFSKSLIFQQSSNISFINILNHSLISIGGALLVGAGIGFLLYLLSGFIKTKNNLLIYMLGFIFIAVGIAQLMHFSVLLSCMFLGAILVNLHKTPFKYFDIIKEIEAPLFLLFFVIAGAHLDISMIKQLSTIALIFRVLGKISGAYVGARISKAENKIKKYIGLGLVPQAGVALGCALIVKEQIPEIGNIVFTTILATTVIYELIGPFCTKIALTKAGEITV